jgi:hypothetical protein
MMMEVTKGNMIFVKPLNRKLFSQQLKVDVAALSFSYMTPVFRINAVSASSSTEPPKYGYP